EELFFRQMTLGVLRRSMNLHLAVWTTAGLFAFAHLTNPFGMPYLFLAGGLFGYARVFGGLPLAMVMHFIHNFVVIAYEAWKWPQARSRSGGFGWFRRLGFWRREFRRSGFLVCPFRFLRRAHPHVDQFHHQRKAHRHIDVALVDVLTQPLGDEHDADQ